MHRRVFATPEKVPGRRAVQGLRVDLSFPPPYEGVSSGKRRDSKKAQQWEILGN